MASRSFRKEIAAKDRFPIRGGIPSVENEHAEPLPSCDEPRILWVEFLRGPTGVFLSFLWGLAEGTLFFVVPDVLLSLVAVFSPRRVWWHIVAATLGAVSGGALMYAWAVADPLSAYAAVQHVPFVTPHMVSEVASGYQQHKYTAVFTGPMMGIPYKIYAVQAPRYLGMPAFLAATVPARAYRFILVSWLAGVLRRIVSARWRLSPRQLAIIHAAAWIIFYGFYWTRIARS